MFVRTRVSVYTRACVCEWSALETENDKARGSEEV